jgi:hypothetical protein
MQYAWIIVTNILSNKLSEPFLGYTFKAELMWVLCISEF